MQIGAEVPERGTPGKGGRGLYPARAATIAVMASMPGSSIPLLFSAKMRARPTVAGLSRKQFHRLPSRRDGRTADLRRLRQPRRRPCDRIEAVKHGLAPKLGLAARLHGIAGGGDRARKLPMVRWCRGPLRSWPSPSALSP